MHTKYNIIYHAIIEVWTKSLTLLVWLEMPIKQGEEKLNKLLDWELEYNGRISLESADLANSAETSARPNID